MGGVKGDQTGFFRKQQGFIRPFFRDRDAPLIVVVSGAFRSVDPNFDHIRGELVDIGKFGFEHIGQIRHSGEDNFRSRNICQLRIFHRLTVDFQRINITGVCQFLHIKLFDFGKLPAAFTGKRFQLGKTFTAAHDFIAEIPQFPGGMYRFRRHLAVREQQIKFPAAPERTFDRFYPDQFICRRRKRTVIIHPVAQQQCRGQQLRQQYSGRRQLSQMVQNFFPCQFARQGQYDIAQIRQFSRRSALQQFRCDRRCQQPVITQKHPFCHHYPPLLLLFKVTTFPRK